MRQQYETVAEHLAHTQQGYKMYVLKVTSDKPLDFGSWHLTVKNGNNYYMVSIKI